MKSEKKKKQIDLFPVVISFYTKHSPYQLEVQNLIETCSRFGLAQSIEGVDSFGSWELNCAYKPFFILQKIKQLKRPVIWVDADGIFLKKPTSIPAFSADLATRINEDCPNDHPSKVISSTVYVNDTKRGVALVQSWAEECRAQLLVKNREEEFWDQIALRDVIFHKKNSAFVQPLPLTYAKIYDHPGDLKVSDPPIIEHYQASRRFKKIINNQM